MFVALVTYVSAGRIVGWRVNTSLKTELALDALEQAAHDRAGTEGLVHHRDRGCQYLSIRYIERLAEYGIRPSVGSTGDSYDNALAESIMELFKTEIIRGRGPWKSIEAAEFAVFQCIGWFNHRRLLESIGDVAPAEFEQAYYRQLEAHALAG